MPRTPTANRSRLLALAVLCAGTLMAILDETVVNVALPSIQQDLGFTQTGLAWVVNAYLIAFAGLLLLSGRLGDLLGRKRMFLTGLTVFTVASALCGLAWTPEVLVAARFVQGVGAAATSAVILGMIVTLFPEPKERAKAIGAFSFVQASGGSLGTLAGGLITEAVSWHWIFFVNVPIGIVALLLAARLLTPEAGLGFGRGADVPGAVLVTAALMVGVYTIVRVEAHGWGSAHTLGFGALALALLAAFVLRQARTANPLLPLRVFRSRAVTGANVILFLLVAAMFGFMFLTVLFLRQVLGFGARDTGFAMVPVALVIAVLSLSASAPLNTRFGQRRVLVAGLGTVAAGLALLGRVPVDATYALDLLPALLLLGAGFGVAMPALMALGMSGATTADAGLVSGLFNTVQQIGGALGLSTLAVLATERSRALTERGTETAHALAGGFHLAYWTAAAVVVSAAVLAALVLRPGRRTAAPARTRAVH